VDEAWNEHGFTAHSWCFWYCTTYHHRLDYDYDSSVDLTVERTASSTELSITPANWEYVEVTYDLGSGVVTDRVYKLNSTPATVGVLTRDAPSRLTIQLNSSTGFTLKILYDNEPLKTYVFPAVA
jgi:uncharacterized protein RhaS with RHS repeats